MEVEAEVGSDHEENDDITKQIDVESLFFCKFVEKRRWRK